MRLRWLAAAALLPAAMPAVAHPHGRLDCQAVVQAGPAGLLSIHLTLTLDAQSSAALAPRLQLDAAGRPGNDKASRQFAELLAGMFRQSGWMLRLQPLGADGEPAAATVALADPGPALWQQAASGQLSVAVVLQPEAAAPAPAPHGWQLACLDPDWYWATGFAAAAQFSINSPCTAELHAMRSVAEQAQALQAAARQAGVAGADQAAPGLLTAPGVRSPAGVLRCPAG